MQPLRIALVTDIHRGPDTGAVRGQDALPLLDALVDAARALRPDLLVDLGDRLTDVDAHADRRHLAEVAARLLALPCRRQHLLGNHDVLPRDEQARTLGGADLGPRALELGGWRLVFLDSFDGTIGGRLAPDTLGWLEHALAGPRAPTVVFSHQPLHGQPMTGNRYFEVEYAAEACPRGSERARAILERAGVVRLCVSGHAHWNDLRRVNGIPYLTVQSLTETGYTAGTAAGAWTLLELGRTIRATVHGRDPFEAQLPA